jgi:hypothetical protein
MEAIKKISHEPMFLQILSMMLLYESITASAPNSPVQIQVKI